MQRHRIIHRQNGTILFEGYFPDLRACTEQAVRDGICLDGADLARANLTNACLDEASLRHASFHGANLVGANLSEARLDHADFTDAELQNACLCFSSLRHATLAGCGFGATDIAGADVSFALFSTLSALTLNFRDAAALESCLYHEDGAAPIPFSAPPVVLQGLYHPVAVFDAHIKIGAMVAAHAELLRHPRDSRPPLRAEDGSTYVFAQRYRTLLAAIIASFSGHYPAAQAENKKAAFS